MAVDTRYKRASAMSVLSPFMPTTHSDGVAAVDDEERWGVSWMYSGIAIDPLVPPTGVVIFRRRIEGY